GARDIVWLARWTMYFSKPLRSAGAAVISRYWPGCDYNQIMKPLTFAVLAALTLFAAIPEVDKGKAYGGPGAPIQMEAFTDFSCSHCKHFHDTIVPLLMRDYVVSGKLYFVNRDWPIPAPGHEYCRTAHAAADAAA